MADFSVYFLNGVNIAILSYLDFEAIEERSWAPILPAVNGCPVPSELSVAHFVEHSSAYGHGVAYLFHPGKVGIICGYYFSHDTRCGTCTRLGTSVAAQRTDLWVIRPIYVLNVCASLSVGRVYT